MTIEIIKLIIIGIVSIIECFSDKLNYALKNALPTEYTSGFSVALIFSLAISIFGIYSVGVLF